MSTPNPGYYSPAEAQALFTKGLDAFSREDFAAASDAWSQLLSHGAQSQAVLFNAGTTALRQNDLGHAVLYLERALALGGGETSDIEANLAVAKSRQLDQVVGAGVQHSVVHRLAQATHPTAVSAAFLATSGPAFLLLSLFLLLKPGRRTWALVTGLFLLLLSLPAGALFAAHLWTAQTLREAVVLRDTLPTRELPRAGAKIAFEVHQGLKLRVLESSGDFVKVRLSNGAEGWAEREGVADL